jgi:parallel beta-helix repeat protein
MVVASVLTVVSFGSTAGADRVSGVLTRTYVIVEDTDLAGDVTCNVGSNPCFSFGASGVELRLNGFTMTGQADPVTACGGATFANEAGILTSGMHNVTVRGPGVVQRFRRWGVHVGGGSTNARIEGITASSNCASGIFADGIAFGTLVQGNVAVRNGSGTGGVRAGGISVAGHNSRVRLNETYGNGFTEPNDDFGIGLTLNASGNVIEGNIVGGNTNGIVIPAGSRQTIVRDNIVVGNAPVQVAVTWPDVPAVDLLNLAPAGEATFERNVCLTAVNAPCAAFARPRP